MCTSSQPVTFVSCIPTPLQTKTRFTTSATKNLKRAAIARQRTKLSMSENGTASPFSSDIPYSSNDTFSGDSASNSEPVDVQAVAVDANTREIPLSDLKCEFYAAVSSTNRGLATSPRQRKEIISLVEQLERQNPTAAPSDAPELSGRWRLLFTNALDIISLSLLAPFALVGQIYQNVYEAEEGNKHDYDVLNIVELEPPFAPITNQFFGQTMAAVEVTAQGFRISDSRVDITFTQSSFKPETLAGFDVKRLPPLRYGLLSPVGYIDTTFLDEDIRVARAPPVGGQDGAIFVLIREVLPLK